MSQGKTTAPQKEKWLRIAVVLSVLTIVYNLIEAGIAVGAGFIAHSIALVGFGFDSSIEVSAGILILRRVLEEIHHDSRKTIAKTETDVHRYVGFTFFILATYITADATFSLWHQSHPQETLIGIVVALLSLLIMPPLSWWKLKAAKAIQSDALASEALETLACSILSLILLVGLGLNAGLGWWWADPIAALLMVPWLLKEGVKALRTSKN